MILDLEFNAYIQQKIHDISDYFSSDLKCDIKTENLKKQLRKLQGSDEDNYERVKKAKHCFSVLCKDNGFSIKATAFGENPIDTINQAFDLLNKQLKDMLDEQVSSKQRVKDISDSYIANQTRH
jgi:ribosome-associated translation inhibitor RaiA